MSKFLRVVLSFVVLALLSAPLRADTADDFLKAYFLIQDGDRAEKEGEGPKAIEKFNAALKALRSIKRAAPDWNPNIISYRMKYVSDHITKLGGKVEEESASEAATPDTRPPVDTVPKPVAPPQPVAETPPVTITPTPAPVIESSPSSSESPALGRVAALERELSQTRAELSKIQQEKTDLEGRLKKAEDDLRLAGSGGDERVEALLKENNSLKDRLSSAENRLKNAPSSSSDIESLRNDLAKTQVALDAARKENEDLRTANASLRQELESTKTQLRTGGGESASMSPETLQTLQKENALLRSIVDRQFQEDARRNAARDALARELRELSTRTESIRSQLEILQTPLTPLSDEERRVLKVPDASIRVAEDPNKLSGVVTAKRTSEIKVDPALASEARQLFNSGDLDGAATKYQKILATDPNNIFALSNLGVIRFRQERIEDAEKYLKAALVADPQDAFSLAVLGIVYYRESKFDDAISVLTKALSINPNNQEAHNYLGITYSQKGYQEAAEKELLKAVELQPNYPDAHFNLAVVFASQNPPSIEMAKKHYKKALDLGIAKDPSLEKMLNR